MEVEILKRGSPPRAKLAIAPPGRLPMKAFNGGLRRTRTIKAVADTLGVALQTC
jgi:hypothetical protein